ncbi:hypothetical protein K431DRAFT_282540 [Polychaeton citri CBS 116435]|uniref:Polynucleotide 5'-hydroxyl-kinase GRC3 n=1 Tax=Polychaeton citri CBS 116435 TaxID=1314669 RepID=A0A9P4QDV8_9PEZI|nr:hypothetical protein K431DRAFT_282540 [Polychaeton citri CBS 116435]
MALPGLSLPGLSAFSGPAQSTSTPAGTGGDSAFAGPSSITRTESLEPRTEWRFEVSFAGSYTIRLLSGTAEIFGSELAPNLLYSFSGVKAAVFTWQGCRLEIEGEAESEYVGSETEYAIEWLNVHGILEGMREDAEAAPQQGGSGGPRVLVVGPEGVGKSSLVRSLTAWGVKMGRTPTVVNLDSREGLLTPPASLVAATAGSQMEVEGNGYGIAPVSGPTVSAIKTPLVYHFPYESPTEKPEIFKGIVTRMATAVTSKLEEDAEAKASGLVIDTPGAALNDPRSNYDLITHIISEFSITVILTIGSERLYSDLTRRFGSNPSSPSDAVIVLRIAKPGGAVERDVSFLKSSRQQETRQYFFGSARETLNPHSQVIGFNDLTIYRARSSAFASEEDEGDNDKGAADDDDDDYEPTAGNDNSGLLFDKVTPSAAMMGGLVAVKFCASSSDLETIRDSAVMAFLYVADVDEARKRLRFLAPHPQRLGDRALVWGAWPEPTAGLVG